MYWY